MSSNVSRDSGISLGSDLHLNSNTSLPQDIAFAPNASLGAHNSHALFPSQDLYTATASLIPANDYRYLTRPLIQDPTSQLSHWDDVSKYPASFNEDSGYSSLASMNIPDEIGLESAAPANPSNSNEVSDPIELTFPWPESSPEPDSGEGVESVSDNHGCFNSHAPLFAGRPNRNPSGGGNSATRDSNVPLDLQEENTPISQQDTNASRKSGHNTGDAEDEATELDSLELEGDKNVASRTAVLQQRENDGGGLEGINQTGPNQVTEWLSGGSLQINPGTGLENSETSLRNLKQVGLARLRIELVTVPTHFRPDEDDNCSIASLDSAMVPEAETDSEEPMEVDGGTETHPSHSTEAGSTSSQGTTSSQYSSNILHLSSGSRKTEEPTDDGERDGPPRKRGRKGPAPGREKSNSIRFACPYQAYDPVGGRHCCQPGLNNRGGGCDGIVRVK